MAVGGGLREHDLPHPQSRVMLSTSLEVCRVKYKVLSPVPNTQLSQTVGICEKRGKIKSELELACVMFHLHSSTSGSLFVSSFPGI